MKSEGKKKTNLSTAQEILSSTSLGPFFGFLIVHMGDKFGRGYNVAAVVDDGCGGNIAS